MSLKFPNYEDIPLKVSPLSEVIAQIRFPSILRISEEQPVSYQEEVRKQFPETEIQKGLEVAVNLSSNEPFSARPTSTIHKFNNKDKDTTITLSSDFVALTTQRYTHWPEFDRCLNLALNALEKVYEPAYSTRVGLRFVNQFTLQNTGLEDINDLLNILRPELTALFLSKVWSLPEEGLSQVALVDETDKLTLRVGVKKQDNTAAGAIVLLDFDMYTDEKLEISHVHEKYNEYHAKIYNAFRWCITEEGFSILKSNIE